MRSATSGPSRRLKVVAAVSAGLIAILYAAAARRLPVGALNDDAGNVLLARSLVRGHYAFPGNATPSSGFLPAFPALIAIPAVLVAPHWGLLRAIPLLFTALALFFTWRLARRFLSDAAAGAAVLFTALNPVWIGHSGLIMPYMPYLALSLALIDAVGERESPENWTLLACGAGLAPLLRPHGAILIAALALALWHRRGFKKACAFGAAAAVPSLLWIFWSHRGADASADYPGVWRENVAALAAPGALTDAAANILAKMLGQGFIIVPGLPRAGVLLLGALTLAAALAGALKLLKARNDPRGFVLAVYTAGVFFLHMTWRWVGNRYVIPVVPALWILILAFATPLLNKRRGAALALLAVFVLLPLSYDAIFALQGLRVDGDYWPKTMAWLRDNTAPSALLESDQNYAVSLLTGRACIPQRIVRHGADWLIHAREKKVAYLHVHLPSPDDAFPSVNGPPTYQPAFAAWLGSQTDAEGVFHDADEGSIVFRVNPPR
jgi:hypothetical protein